MMAPASSSDAPVPTTTTAASSSQQQAEARPKQPHRRSPKQFRIGSRQSRRGSSSLKELAKLIVNGKNVVIITGAGLSVASGVRPFRGSEGLWSTVIWQMATRVSFRKDPLQWYNDFWLPHFGNQNSHERYHPNAGHVALEQLVAISPNVKVITQNIDGLHDAIPSSNLIEAHGRVGLYKCLPFEDSDTDSDSDEEEHRPVHLGHLRKSRAMRRAYYQQQEQQQQGIIHNNSSTTTTATSGTATTQQEQTEAPSLAQPQEMETSNESTTTSAKATKHHYHVPCKYELMESIPVHLLEPPSVRDILMNTTTTSSSTASPNNKNTKKRSRNQQQQQQHRLSTPPRCPACHRPCPPQALLFDEGYHSHDFYQFEQMEHWLSTCDALVFVGTSFAVRITNVALEQARSTFIPVFNFNTTDMLESTVRLNVENVMGKADETLPRLVQACHEALVAKKEANNNNNDDATSY